MPQTDYFDLHVENGTLILQPVTVVPAVDLEDIRHQIEQVGITEHDIAEAVQWARQNKPSKS